MNAHYTDQELKCSDCGTDFTFTAGEQEFYKARGLLNTPKRCPACRASRKQRSGGRVDRPATEVVCDQCGVQTKVPFVPRQNRPVLCRDCFQKSRVVE